MTDEENRTRLTIGKMFHDLPGLENIELTIGGQRYRAHRAGQWVVLDHKPGKRWTVWTECRV